MIRYILDAVAHDDVVATVIVVGYGAQSVEKEVRQQLPSGEHLTFVDQAQQLGTGHAVLEALPTINHEIGTTDGDVLIVPGDAPLLRASTVRELLTRHRDDQSALTVLSALVEDPFGYGRIVRSKDGAIVRIVEERDASADERAISEINTSIMVVRASLLGPALRRVDRKNAQHEYLLTDLVAVLHEAGHATKAMVLRDPFEAAGVNNRAQLATAEAALRLRINEGWMQRGVTMWDPSCTYIDADVQLSPDVSLLPGTVLKGHCEVQRGAQIGPNAFLTDVIVGENAHVAMVEATNVRVGDDARVHSFAVLGPGVVVARETHVAPFENRTH